MKKLDWVIYQIYRSERGLLLYKEYLCDNKKSAFNKYKDFTENNNLLTNMFELVKRTYNKNGDITNEFLCLVDGKYVDK